MKNDSNSQSHLKVQAERKSIKPPPMSSKRIGKVKRREPAWKWSNKDQPIPETKAKGKSKKKMLKILQSVLPLERKVFNLKA